MRARDETPDTDALRAAIERQAGGRVSVVPDVIVGAGRTRATLRGGPLVLRSVTVQGGALDALTALQALLERTTW